MEQTLACIAMGEGERTHERFLDTIKGYVPGNWVYEWSQLAATSTGVASWWHRANEPRP